MILYIADNKRIEKYYLPNHKTNENFLFKYIPDNMQVEYFFNVFYKNGNWYFKNDENFSIRHNKYSEPETLLTEYTSYPLNILGCNTNPILFCCSSTEKNKRCFQIKEDTTSSIIIGNTKECQIYDSKLFTFSNFVRIDCERGIWYLLENKDPNCYLYLNNKKVEKKRLKRGDVIFINGVKIVWMQEFIKIPDMDVVSVRRLPPIKNPELENYIEDTYEEENILLYEESEYFYHKPYLKNTVKQKKVLIDPPPKNELKEELPAWLSIGSRLTMIVFSLVMCLNAYNTYLRTQDFASTLPSILMATSMIIGAIIFPTIAASYQKNQSKKREQLRQDKYCAYLSQKVNEIKANLEEEKQVYFENNPSAEECYQIATNKKSRIWTRVITDDDFLSVRVGTGTIPTTLEIDAPKKHFELYDDNLFETVYKIVNDAKNLYNVPITTSFSKNTISSIISDEKHKDNYVNGILMQLLTHQSSKDLKIVVFTSEKNKNKWEYLKNAPHCWNNEKTTRYFATDLEEMKELATTLEKELVERRQQDTKTDNEDKIDDPSKINKQDFYINFKSYYLIITDNYKDAKNLSLINELTEIKKNYGFSILLITNSIQELPNTCNNFIYVNGAEKVNCVLTKDENGKKQTNFIPEYANSISLNKAIATLANIPIAIDNNLSTLPTVISFLEMYRVGRVEQLNILNRWQTSNPINSLQAPIGVYQNGDIFKLDVHEKSHGPHGLVAGSTGSGKSEFLITYILSMAVNYHPDYVQFVLIDYKGGGLAGAFENRETGEKIPHLAGTITNLDSSSINRTLVSIESELKRRQEQFNIVRNQTGESTIDIYKYQKLYHDGVVSEPIPHLIIISDEFAELKQQQPEFMAQLISTARIGRSLGVHLVLATQKPSGVVNDQIWSNSKFKICLRVQTRQDSMEMLKREEAANIKETGRFYLQVGYNELFEEGQSAWCGAPYIPSDKIVKKVDNSIDFIDNIGRSIKKIDNIAKQNVEASQGEQLTSIVKHLIDIAQRENITSKTLWLEPLKDEIYITNLKNKYNFEAIPYNLEAIVGEYDNPTSQQQGLATIKLTSNGNVLIYGETGSGKENLIYTIISSLIITHSPLEINFYLVDFASETMKRFSDLPHVGDVIYSDDTEKLNNLIIYIDEEINKRKTLFENYMGSYNNYITSTNNKLPQIIISIAGYDVLIENHPKIIDKLASLFRDSSKYGIYFIISTTIANAVRYRTAQLFPNKICLQLQDVTDYRSLMEAPKGVFPARKFGRGLIKIGENVFEFQTAILCPSNTFNKVIDKYAEEYSKVNTFIAPKIKVLPPYFLASTMIKNNEVTDLQNIPIGIRKNNLNTVKFDFTSTKILPIISNFLDEEFGFITGLIEEFKTLPNIKVRVLDFSGICNFNYENVPIYKDDFDTVIQQIDIELDKDATSERTTIFIFVGIGSIKNRISTTYHPFIEKIFNRISSLQKNIFIIADNYISYRSIESEKWLSANINNTTGIWLGDGVGNQMSIKINNIDLNDRRIVFKDMAYLINKGKPTLIKHITDKKKEDENE